jgi:hypothetical protein
MILVDAHVHIHDCYNVGEFFDSACTNFKFAAERLGHENNFTGILLLTETPNENWFGRLANYAIGLSTARMRNVLCLPNLVILEIYA